MRISSAIKQAFWYTKKPRKFYDRLCAPTIARIIGPPLSPFRKGQIAMVHVGRCGSAVLADLLSQHRDVFWDSEIYEQEFHRLKRKGKLSNPGSIPLDPYGYLRKRMRLAGMRYYGFAIKPYHLDWMGVGMDSYLQQIRGMGYERVMVIERKNYLRVVLSYVVARLRSQYHQWDNEKSQKTAVTIDPSAVTVLRETKPLTEFLDDYDKAYRELERITDPKDTLWLTYEDDISEDPLRAYRKTCEFFGLEPRHVKISFRKTNPYPIREMVTNYSDLKRALEGTKHEWMLEENQ